MITIAELLQHANEIDSDTPLLDAQVLLAHVLQCSRTYLYTWPEKAVSANQEHQFLQILERRKQGEPIAHLVKSREFWSLSLAVSPATLIPRADTELLVEKALELELPDCARVLDLGTGTGAIALALASERPQWRLVAVDSEQEAVQLALENAESLRLNNVEIFHSDWFASVEGRFDLIVSNPPYIAETDHHLAEGDVRFEPRSALVSGEDGLDDLRHIVSGAGHFLAPRGWLLVEHGYDQGDSVRSLFIAKGFAAVQTLNDLVGLPRITFGQLA